MKILFVNEAQGDNLGDQAIYKGIVSLFSTFKNVDLIQVQLSFNSGSNKLVKESQDNLRFIKKNKYIHSIVLFIRLFLLNFFRLIPLFNHIRRSELVIFGGGSLLINNKLVFPINLLFISSLCRLLRVPYGVAGVSTRKIESELAKKIIKIFLKKSSFNYVRDIRSQQLCEHQFLIHVDILPDFALLLKNDARDPKEKSIAVNIMGRQIHGFFSDDEKFENYVNSICELIISNRNEKLILFTTGEHTDIDTARIIKNKVLAFDDTILMELVNPSNIDELYKIYKSEVVFATRLHSSIIGLALGCRVVCFNWDEKVDGFFEYLNLKSCLIQPYDVFSSRLNHAKNIDTLPLNYYDSFLNDVMAYEKEHN